MRAFTRRFRGNAIPIAYRSPPPVSPLWLRLQAEVEGPLARRACSDLTGQAAAAAALAVSVTAAASATAKTSITAALSAVKPSTRSASSRRSGPARREPTDLAAVNVNQAARGLPPDVGRWRRVQGGGARLQVAISSAWRMGLAEPAEQVPGPLGGGGARQPLADVQGLMISTPVPSKSSRLRAASTAPRERQTAAIRASKPAIGFPARSRALAMIAYSSAAAASTGRICSSKARKVSSAVSSRACLGGPLEAWRCRSGSRRA